VRFGENSHDYLSSLLRDVFWLVIFPEGNQSRRKKQGMRKRGGRAVKRGPVGYRESDVKVSFRWFRGRGNRGVSSCTGQGAGTPDRTVLLRGFKPQSGIKPLVKRERRDYYHGGEVLSVVKASLSPACFSLRVSLEKRRTDSHRRAGEDQEGQVWGFHQNDVGEVRIRQIWECDSGRQGQNGKSCGSNFQNIH